MNKEFISKGKYRKTKAYGLVGCLSFMILGASLSLSSLPYVGIQSAQAAVVDGGSDIKETDVNDDKNDGVAMTYTRFDNGSSKQTASGSGVFVAPNVMVTVAHNYLDKNKETNEGFVRGGDSAQSYVVTNSSAQKKNGNPSNGESQLINKGDIHYYNAKELGSSYTNDLAVTVLDKPIEAMTDGNDSYRNIGTAEKGDRVRLVGYPNDFSSKNISSENRERLQDGKLYEISGTLSELNTSTGEGKYHTSALGGFSGGPIFNDKGDVVGIHQHGTNSDATPEAQQYGAGLFFTEKHKAWIKEMIDKYAIKGWYVDGDKKYYYNENHEPLKNIDKDIDGARYHFDENGRGTLISGKETGRVLLRAVDKQGDILFERVVGTGQVGSGFSYDFKSDKNNQAYFSENPNATVVSIDSENIGKKFSEKWDKDFASKYQLGNTIIKVVIDGGQKFTRTASGSVDTGSSGVKPLIADDKVKSVPNGEKNFNATVSLTSEAGLGSGTLINDDTIVTVAHNFVHLNTKTNPISVVNNVNKSGDIHLATLPNGKQVRFSNNDVHFWNREGFVNGFKNDLAVIKLRNKFTGESGARLHDTVQDLSSGDTIHVFGFPKGKLNPILNGKVETVENYGANIRGVAYQGSAPGMSGGGMYNAQGELIGVHQNGVEGMRSGGIAFSKEQLDWIKAIVNGENTSPVYLKDEPLNNDKDETSENNKLIVKNGGVVFGDKFDFTNYSRKNIDIDLSSVTKVTLIGNKKGNDKFIKDWVNEAKTKFTRTDLGDMTLLRDGLFVTTIDDLIASNDEDVYSDGVYTLGYSRVENEVVKHGYKYSGDSNIPFNTKVLQIEGRDGERPVTYIYTVSSNGEVSTKPIRVADESFVGLMLDGEYYVGNQSKGTHEIDVSIRYKSDDSKLLNEQEVVNPGSKGLRTIITTYSVNFDTGALSNPVVTETNEPMIERIIKVGTKPKVTIETIESEIVYVKDSTREKGSEDITELGKKGTNVITTTYTVDEKTGVVEAHVGQPVVTNSTNTIVKVAAKDKVDTKTIPSPIRYEKDGDRDKGVENITNKGKDGSVVITTTYNVDPKTGNVTETVGEPVITEPIDTVVKVAAKDKVEVVPRDGKKFKVTTTYNVNSKTGEITSKTSEVELPKETDSDDVDANRKLPDKVEIIKPGVVYEKDATREKGAENITIQGKDGQKLTPVTKEKDLQTGKLVEKLGEPKITPAKNTIVKVAAKDKVETKEIPAKVLYVGDESKDKGSEPVRTEGNKGKEVTTTVYTVNPKTGEITEQTSTKRTEEPTETVVKVGSKSKVETIRKNGDTIERTTKYTVNPETGKITEEVIDRLIASNGNGIKPPVVENNDFNGGVNGDVDGSALINEKPEFDLTILKNFDLGTGLNDFGLKKDTKKDDLQLISVNDSKDNNSNNGFKRSEKPASEKPVSQLPNTAGGDNMAINGLGALTLISVLGLAVTKRKKEDN